MPFETRRLVALAETFVYELDVTHISEEDKGQNYRITGDFEGKLIHLVSE